MPLHPATVPIAKWSSLQDYVDQVCKLMSFSTHEFRVTHGNFAFAGRDGSQVRPHR